MPPHQVELEYGVTRTPLGDTDFGISASVATLAS
jgi:hypothetical protein